MSGFGKLVGPDGETMHNEPGTVVVRVFRVQGDGETVVDIGGALVRPALVDRVREIRASLGGVLGAEIVNAIEHDVHGPPDAEAEGAPPVESDPLDELARFANEALKGLADDDGDTSD